MFVLGHAVLGPRLALVARPTLPLRWLVVGGLLPDLIDKPLYYGLSTLTGRHGADLGLISGTRTFGHTGLLLLALVLLAVARRSPAWAALAWGDASHLLLDNIGDLLTRMFSVPQPGPSALSALLFPLLGPHFPISYFLSLKAHLGGVTSAYVLFGELVGGAILLVAAWRHWRRQVA